MPSPLRVSSAEEASFGLTRDLDQRDKAIVGAGRWTTSVKSSSNIWPAGAAYAGIPTEAFRLSLLALEREENVAVAYGESVLRRRLVEIP